ncbi:MAG: type II toxin-antitoxin system mRNA interferase toxin, RelE/StbE family [Patescibacteria group bacterium]
MNENGNLPEVKYSKLFLKQIKHAPLRIKEAFRKRRALFLKDPYHVQLHNHFLTGSLQRYRSINITGDWRVLFRMLDQNDRVVIFFDAIGTHSQLYR